MTIGHRNSVGSPFGMICYNVTSDGDIAFGNGDVDPNANPLRINGVEYRNSGVARMVKRPGWNSGYVQIDHYSGWPEKPFTANAREKLSNWFLAHWDELADSEAILDAKIRAAESTVSAKANAMKEAEQELAKAEQALAELLSHRS